MAEGNSLEVRVSQPHLFYVEVKWKYNIYNVLSNYVERFSLLVLFFYVIFILLIICIRKLKGRRNMKKYIRQLVAGFLIICMMFIQVIGNKVELLAAENGNLEEYVITTKNQKVVKRIKEKYDKFVFDDYSRYEDMLLWIQELIFQKIQML